MSKKHPRRKARKLINNRKDLRCEILDCNDSAPRDRENAGLTQFSKADGYTAEVNVIILFESSVKARRLMAPCIALINTSVKPFRASLFSEEAHTIVITSIYLVTGFLITTTFMRRAITGIVQGIDSLFPISRFAPRILRRVP